MSLYELMQILDANCYITCIDSSGILFKGVNAKLQHLYVDGDDISIELEADVINVSCIDRDHILVIIK